MGPHGFYFFLLFFCLYLPLENEKRKVKKRKKENFIFQYSLFDASATDRIGLGIAGEEFTQLLFFLDKLFFPIL